MYNNGGWKIMPASCSSGFMSWPSGGVGRMRSNGFEVNRVNNRKPIEIIAITASTRARNTRGSVFENSTTAIIQPASIRIHSSSEPSCPPQTAVMR